MNQQKPPRVAAWVLSRVAPGRIRSSALGDFEEQFHSIARERGIYTARLWYTLQAIGSVPSFLRESLYWSFAMFRNYLKLAIRNLLNARSYSFINLSGLSIGIACCILIFLYVTDELSYDTFHSRSVYRITDDLVSDDARSAVVSPDWGPMIAQNFGEVTDFVRIRRMSRFTPLVAFEEKRFYEAGIWFADSSFFSVFNFKFIEGDPKTALSGSNSIVITSAVAQKYFGNEPAIGKPLTYNNDRVLYVTGIVERPDNTHLDFDMIRPLIDPPPGRWVYTYLVLGDKTDVTKLESGLARFLKKNYAGAGDAKSFRFVPGLQAVGDIHLHSDLQFELGSNGNIHYVTLLSAIAFLILLVACVNFMNLTTARSTRRAREVGIRKVVGAHRMQIARQFLGESVMMTLFSLLLALVIVELVLPVFNDLAGKSLTPAYRGNLAYVFALFGSALVLGLLAGSYPAFFLSSFRPAKILKGQYAGEGGASLVRKVLVVSQFTVSIVMLIGTGTIYDQLQYVRNKRLGFDQEQVVTIKSKDWELNRRYETFKSEILKNPDVLGVSFMQSLPGQTITSFRYTLQGNQDDQKVMTAFAVDHDFIKTLGMEMTDGRDFSQDFGDEWEAFILNESAVRSLGWEEPVGQEMAVTYMEKFGRVVGVVKDFHFSSLHQTIQPAVLQVMPPNFYTMMAVRVRAGKTAETLKFLKNQWEQFSPNYPFEFSFLNEELERLYRADHDLGRIFGYFSFLAILVACMGLFGLAWFSSERYMKQIGVRKVMGATTWQMVLLLTGGFTKLIVLAIALAVPIGYFSMGRWLMNFAYRIDIGWEIFAAAGLFALVISWATVGYHTIKAARANPVSILRYE